jgi:hypothetical protein
VIGEPPGWPLHRQVSRVRYILRMPLPRVEPIIPVSRKEPFDYPDWLLFEQGRSCPFISRRRNILTCFDALAARPPISMWMASFLTAKSLRPTTPPKTTYAPHRYALLSSQQRRFWGPKAAARSCASAFMARPRTELSKNATLEIVKRNQVPSAERAEAPRVPDLSPYATKMRVPLLRADKCRTSSDHELSVRHKRRAHCP